jgi:hypothetical protein
MSDYKMRWTLNRLVDERVALREFSRLELLCESLSYGPQTGWKPIPVDSVT